MQHKYVDLDVEIRTVEDAVILFPLFRHLGYKGIAVRLPDQLLENIDKVENFIHALLEISKKNNLMILFKICFNARKIEMPFVKQNYLRYLQIADEAALRKAIFKREYRLLSISITVFPYILKEEIVNLIKQARDKYIEITLRDLFYIPATHRRSIISMIFRKSRLFNKPDLPLIVSSGAKNKNDLLSPRCIRSFLRILGFKEDRILDIMVYNPSKVSMLPSLVTMTDAGS